MRIESKTVLDRYQIRKSKAQKQAFRTYLRGVAQQQGYTTTEERGAFGATNLIVGSPDTAKVVYTAHYDTCAVLPFPNFITPKNILLYLLYQLVVTVFLILPGAIAAGIAVGIGVLCSVEADWIALAAVLLFYVLLLVTTAMIIAGPANKSTVNDNTSGVLTLIEIMCALPEEQRDHVAFVFFDLEEAGLFGSAGFYSRHKKAMQRKLLVNFDCVSDGEHMLFATRKRAKQYVPALEQAFPATAEVQSLLCTRGVFYPSDQANFPCGVGVAALKYSRILRTLYLDRIHTKRDTVCREQNIEYLTTGAVRLVGLL